MNSPLQASTVILVAGKAGVKFRCHEKQKELEERTVDVLRVGEMQPERDHDFVGERSRTGETRGRKWRSARDSGYFAFTMKVDPAESNTVIATYWGMGNRSRGFDILVNDAKVGSDDLVKYKMNKFYYIVYPIPRELTAGKTTVTVKFAPRRNNEAGPVYGVRMAKGDVSSLLTQVTNESIYR